MVVAAKEHLVWVEDGIGKENQSKRQGTGW